MNSVPSKQRFMQLVSLTSTWPVLRLNVIYNFHFQPILLFQKKVTFCFRWFFAGWGFRRWGIFVKCCQIRWTCFSQWKKWRHLFVENPRWSQHQRPKSKPRQGGSLGGQWWELSFFFWGPSRDPLTMLPSNQEQLGTSNFLWGSSEKCICSDNVTSIPPLSGRTWRVFRDFCWKHPIFTKMTWLTPFRWKSPISHVMRLRIHWATKIPCSQKKTSPKPSSVPQRSWTQDFVWQEKNGILVRLSSRVSGETQRKNTARCFRCAKLDFLNIHIMLECVVLSKLRLRHLISSAYLGCFTNLYCAFKSCIFWGGRSLPGGSFQRFHVGKCGASIFGKEVTVENRNPGA